VCHLVKESSNKRLIFDLPQFQGMNCFEIGHSLQSSGMFECKPDAKQKIGLRTSHPVWIKLREMYGLANKKRVRGSGSSSASSSEYESDSDSSEEEDAEMEENKEEEEVEEQNEDKEYVAEIVET